MLDLRHIMLGDTKILRFATKRQASALAKQRGWNACDIVQAYNRFNIFWIVGERLSDGLRVAADVGTVNVPYAKGGLNNV